MRSKAVSLFHPDLYEHALILADAQSRNSRDPWESFIDNLSRICDAFAQSIESSEKKIETKIPDHYKN